ncbi:MAG: hypothetical protein VW146_01175 [Gammaproteobacteria bacterium]
MAINSRTKGANFEREIGNLLQDALNLKNPVRRILEQTRTKELPDLKLGRWCLECKRYGTGSEPLEEWWEQVANATGEKEFSALVYKFNRRPIKVRISAATLNPNLSSNIKIDLLWDDFLEVLRELYQEDILTHENTSTN